MTEDEKNNLLNSMATDFISGEEKCKVMEEVQITLSTITGGGGLTTLRVVGEVGHHKINILVDSGSTLSFINESTAKTLGCKLESAKPLLVKVANGNKMVSSKRISGFKWKMQQHQFTYSPRVISTEGFDLILGGDWLKSCTPVDLDYERMTITITWLGNRVKLQALKEGEQCHLITGPVLCHMIHQEWNSIEEIYWVKFKEDHSEYPSELDLLLEEFQDIFEEPQGLPPSRGVEHQIILKPGSAPKQQFPYRVSHDQKGEIEKIVSSLLKSGEIQHSRSPFASPVLLVKKKDSSWRLCVDYRYLNSLTIKHNFPIPVIEELLDELNGSSYFSKIDLRSGYFEILMAPDHRQYTTFRTHSGHYEFLVMSFGLCNAPATFQSLMNLVFER